MGKKNRKGKENNAAKTSFLKVENIKNTNSGLELPSQDYTNVEEKESSPKTDFPLITKEHRSLSKQALNFSILLVAEFFIQFFA